MTQHIAHGGTVTLVHQVDPAALALANKLLAAATALQTLIPQAVATITQAGTDMARTLQQWIDLETQLKAAVTSAEARVATTNQNAVTIQQSLQTGLDAAKQGIADRDAQIADLTAKLAAATGTPPDPNASPDSLDATFDQLTTDVQGLSTIDPGPAVGTTTGTDTTGTTGTTGTQTPPATDPNAEVPINP